MTHSGNVHPLFLRLAVVCLGTVCFGVAPSPARADEPSVLVRGRVTSPELEAAGIALRPLFVRATAADGLDVRIDLTDSPDAAFEFLANPGGLEIEAHGENVISRKLPYTIPLARETYDIGDFKLDGPPYARVGERAPDFDGLIGWLGGMGPTPDDLAGRHVFVDFWGTWCKPCLAAFPSLYALHDEFGPDRLVIVAVHDATHNDVAALESALREIADRSWEGRMPPFHVALDALPDRSQRSFDGQRFRGAVIGRWGVLRFPTSVLVGPDGTIVARVTPYDIAGIRRIIGSAEEPVTQAGSERPAGREGTTE